MTELQTFLGNDIPLNTRGILYLCDYDPIALTLTVDHELLFTSAFEALEAYANVPNPESQLVTGKDYNELILELNRLHENMKNPVWLRELGDYI